MFGFTSGLRGCHVKSCKQKNNWKDIKMSSFKAIKVEIVKCQKSDNRWTKQNSEICWESFFQLVLIFLTHY